MTANLHIVTEPNDAREQLAEAVAIRNEARAAVQRAEAVLSRSAAGILSLETDLEDIVSADERAIEQRAQAMRKALLDGTDAPRPLAASMLGDTRLRSHEAQSNVEAAQKCHDILSKERDEAQAELTLRQSNVEHAARAVTRLRRPRQCERVDTARRYGRHVGIGAQRTCGRCAEQYAIQPQRRGWSRATWRELRQRERPAGKYGDQFRHQ
jgi:hypothetical protein